jgi:hypothetical protein
LPKKPAAADAARQEDLLDGPFEWFNDATVKIAVTTAGTDRAALLLMPSGLVELEFYNAGSVPVFVRHGADATVTASASRPDKPIQPGTVEVLAVNNDPSSPVTHVAAVTASGAAALYITTGGGVPSFTPDRAGEPTGLLLLMTKAS